MSNRFNSETSIKANQGKKVRPRKRQDEQDSIMKDIQDLNRCIMNSDISSIDHVSTEYFPSKVREDNEEEMVLIPKKKLMNLIKEI